METPTGAPQFDTAEFASTTAGDHCKFCNQPIGGVYYRVNGAMACGSCADKAQRDVPISQHKAFVRAFAFGIPAALLGFILYAGIGIITGGWVIGFMSLGVGYLVGKAMMKGSGGIGGRRYQLTAVLLTYMAVSMAAIPIAISQYAGHKKGAPAQKQTTATTQQQAPAGTEGAQQTTGAPAADQKSAADTQPKQSGQQAADQKPPMPVGRAFLTLAVIGLISPFLALASPVSGIIGLFILFIGLQIAWKITAGSKIVEVSGPFQTGAGSAAGAS